MMRFATTGGERTIEELVERLYRTEGRGAAGAVRRAQKGLRDLNPQLKAMADVPEGTPILVPDIEGADSAGREVPLGQAVLGAVPGDAETAFEAALDDLERRIAEERDDARRAVKLLRSRELKAAAKDVPGAAAQLERALAGAQERLEDAKALELYHRTLTARSR